jgi:hypothetical protein
MLNRYALCTLFGISSLFCQLAFATPGTDTIPRLTRIDNAIDFLVVGDWGQMGSPSQREVAAAMAAAGKQLNISFVISTGDNFYPAGVRDVNDSQWIHSFENVYDAPPLRRKWMAVLGNHDYLLNPQAQVNYTFENDRWYMPARYYDTSIAACSDSILFVFLDTEPIEKQLRGIPADNTKYFPGYVEQQLTWLKNVLSSSKAKWKIVTGHHPLHTGGSRRHNSRIKKLRKLLQPILYANHVTLYLSGHEHHLELLKPKKGSTHYVISGAGSETRHVGRLKRYRRFAARKKGFVSISISSQAALIQFISDKKKLLYDYRL